MIGFVVGSLVAIGIIRAVRFRRYARWASAHGHDGYPRFDGWYGGFGPRARLVNLIDRMRLSPAQKESFKEARSEVKTALASIKETLSDIRNDVAIALSAPAFEEELVGATTAKLDLAVDTLRQTLVSLVGRAHTTLDEDQRLELARLLTRGTPQNEPAFL